MSASGVTVDSQCLTDYNDLKLSRKYKYIIFKINDDKTSIIVEKASTEGDYEKFLEELPEATPRWAVYDFEFEKEDGGKRNKLTFIAWSPDDSKIKEKMVYASSKDALRKALVGIAIEIQGTDSSEVAYETQGSARSLNNSRSRLSWLYLTLPSPTFKCCVCRLK
ncbi:hypothetical protein DL96DRAFT_164872 [Flagelloscypha sp. PMI_526]|nr:hypothetical protein DL96DRAFT_164872 [Flagelloscypha sp. PMI_526]